MTALRQHQHDSYFCGVILIYAFLLLINQSYIKLFLILFIHCTNSEILNEISFCLLSTVIFKIKPVQMSIQMHAMTFDEEKGS